MYRISIFNYLFAVIFVSYAYMVSNSNKQKLQMSETWFSDQLCLTQEFRIIQESSLIPAREVPWTNDSFSFAFQLLQFSHFVSKFSLPIRISCVVTSLFGVACIDCPSPSATVALGFCNSSKKIHQAFFILIIFWPSCIFAWLRHRP